MIHLKYIRWTIFTLFTAALISCAHSHSEGDAHGHDNPSKDGKDGHGHENPDHVEGLHLTKEQIETIGLKFGDFSEIKINDFVKASGTLGLPPNAFASINPKSNGIIRGNKKYVEGNYIKKGEIIAYIENPDLITSQQEYLEALAQLKINRLNLDRQEALVKAGAGVKKNVQNAQAQVDVLIAKTNGLRTKLNYLGIRTSGLTPDNIVSKIAIIAPMSGYISSINYNNGLYALSTQSLMEIIADDHLHLELDVFEKDIAKVKIGQLISYTVPAFGNTSYDGEISVMGKEFNPSAKTLRVHGHLEGTKPKFIKDLYINAKIWLSDETVSALPEKAIIKEGASSFIFAAVDNVNAAETSFDKLMVKTGPSDNGYTSVDLIDPLPTGMRIVTKGAYFVYAQSMAGELKHEH